MAVLDAGDLADQLHRVVAGRGDAGGGDADLPGPGLHRVEQFPWAVVRGLRVDADHLDVGDIEEQVPVLDAGLERPQRFIAAQVLRRARRPGVAVPGRIERALGADRAGGARLVDDDDGLPQRLFHFCSRDARDLVGRAARGPGHDQVDWPARLPLLRHGRTGSQDGDGKGNGLEEMALLHGGYLQFNSLNG